MSELMKEVPDGPLIGYHEFFAGGAALFYALRPSFGPETRVTLNDLNERLMTTYMAIRDDVEGVVERLRPYVTTDQKYGKDAFNGVRKGPPIDPSGIAAWFIFVMARGFNGVYRVNKANEFNVPYGKWKKMPPPILNEPLLHACANALQGVRLLCQDFDSLADDVRPGEVVYCDPPYVPRPKADASESDFTEYTADGFKDADQVRLRDCALRMKERGVRVILSNSDVPRVRELYASGFTIRRVEARRSVNSNIEARGPVGEVIIT